MPNLNGKTPVAITDEKSSAARCDTITSCDCEPSWEDLLAEFRALGGTAENIALGHGQSGRGLFPIDPAKPVRVRTPPNLLVPSEDTELRNGQLVVKASAMIGVRERSFFDHYQKEFS